MERDCHDYVKQCVKYQQYAHLIHTPSQALQPIQAMWSFSWWGFDLIGQFSLPSLGGKTFITTNT